MTKQTGPKPIQSVVRAMSLLHSVAEHDGASCTELARAVGLKAQTALNLLRTLVQLAYLDFDPQTKRYHVGPMPAAIGGSGNGLRRLRRLTEEPGVRLAHDLDMVVAVHTFIGGRFVNVLIADPSGARPPSPATGTPVGHYAGATTQILTAFADSDFILHYAQSVSFDATDKGKDATRRLLTRLSRVRGLGYAENIGTVNKYVGAIAVPAFAADGRLVLSICASAERRRFTKQVRADCVVRLQRTASELSALLNNKPCTGR
jgi:DNA-binding IclR family transcriptional regulator